MSAHTRTHHTNKTRLAEVKEEKVEYLDDWRESFKDLIEKHTEQGLSLKSYRTAEGWTQTHLAKLLGVDRANVSNMESGKRPIGKTMAKRLAKIFDTDYRLFI